MLKIVIHSYVVLRMSAYIIKEVYEDLLKVFWRFKEIK